MCVYGEVQVQSLLDISSMANFNLEHIQARELWGLGLFHMPTRPPTSTAVPHAERGHGKQCENRQKRGKRGDIRTRLATSLKRQAIPSVLLASVLSLDNKMDHIYLIRSVQCNVRMLRFCIHGNLAK